MAIYFYSLLATLIMGCISDVAYKKNNISKNRGWQAFFISLPLATVAGLRTIDIGTDIQVYGRGAFKAATSSQSMLSYITAMDARYGIEHGYDILNFLVSRFTDNINIFLFILSLVTLIPFVLGALSFRRTFSIPIWIQLGVFWGLNYGGTLNIMRQSVSMSIVYLAVAILLSKRGHNVRNYFLLLILAFEFHRTAVIAIIFFIIFEYVEVGMVKVKLSVRLPALILSISSIAIIGAILIKKLANTGFLSKYQSYTDSSNWLVQTSYGWGRILLLSIGALLVAVLFGFYLYLSTNKIFKKYVVFLLLVLIIDIATQFSASSGKLFTRLGLYFGIFEAISLPLGMNVLFNKRIKIVGYLIVLGYVIFVFFTVTKSGSGEIYPYQWILNLG